MKLRLRIIAIVFATAVQIQMAPIQSSLADSPLTAKIFVENVANQVVATIDDKKLTKEQKIERYGQIFDYALDISLIARISIGHHFRNVSTEQRKLYFSNFRTHIIEVYSGRFGGFLNAKLDVLNEIKSSKDTTLVSGKIGGPNMKPKDTVFRVRRGVDGFKIVDVTIDGISLVLTKRSEFNSIVYHHGIEELIDALARKKLGRANPARVFNAF